MRFFGPNKLGRIVLLAVLAGSCTSPQKKSGVQQIAGRYAEHVRTTDFQSPAQQRKGFKLPPGFEITLFASEPQIGKPMNMEFDDRGRLWITQSTEYPMAATDGPGKDKIVILEDTDGDGKADRFTDFKTELNIPIGIMPMADGAIAYSIPNLYYFRDQNGDGRADSSEVLLGPFGFTDTHGMINNLIRGYDGWVHSSHGFSNTSRIAGKDGDSLVMISGNTFRFRTDGSRAEQTTFGRVNPFGFAYDERGYLYSVDCHSKPLYQLIPGADYPHFGKKPTGIGFAPEMTGYELGSTALSGLVYYTGRQFPETYRNNFFIGDVVTSRISRNSVSFSGSTPALRFEEDFLVSEDPWFRPVDIKLGPDGAIYVADFYNRIIGHYEVNLNHPGRDRTSGRIWRITYTGGGTSPNAKKDWSKAPLEELLVGLSEPQLNIRMRIADRIFDAFGMKAASQLKAIAADDEKSTEARIQALWLSQRLGTADDRFLEGFVKSEIENLRIHGLRVVGQKKEISDRLSKWVVQALKDSSPFVKRTSAEVVSRLPSVSHLAPLIDLYQSAAPEDTHLRHTVLLAIRNNLASPEVSRTIVRQKWSDLEQEVLAKASIDLEDKTMANFVLTYLLAQRTLTVDQEQFLPYVSAMISPGQAEVLARKAVGGFKPDEPRYLERLELIAGGQKTSGRAVSPEISKLSSEAALGILGKFAALSVGEIQVLGNESRQSLLAAIACLGQYRIKRAGDLLVSFLPLGYPLDIQKAATIALAGISATAYTPVFEELVRLPATSDKYKETLVGAIAADPSQQNLNFIRRQLPGGSRNLQIEIFSVLLKTNDGATILKEALESGEAPVELLQVRRVKTLVDERLKRTRDQNWEELLKRSEGSVSELENLLVAREFGALTYKGSVDKGRAVFSTNCASCHQIKGVGGLVGPQLDGIGNWGVKALTEKILSPNRNVTEAFKTYQITMRSGDKKLGLYRRTEGATMVFADHAGQEFSVQKEQIETYEPINMTIMPDQFRYSIPENDFYELIAYLSAVK